MEQTRRGSGAPWIMEVAVGHRLWHIAQADETLDPLPPFLAANSPKEASSRIERLQQETGTGRRALLPGIRVAGKTGTTQSYRDAWFVGYSGNYLAAVWFGNDDFSATNRMTGGLLPAMTWQRLMAYAHQNIEIKPIPGLKDPFIEKPADKPEDVKVAEAKDAKGVPIEERVRPAVLNQNTKRALDKLLEQFRSAPKLPLLPDGQKVSAIAD